MSSNIHSLKNRPDLPRRVQEAFKTWSPLMAEMKSVHLWPEAQTENRVFLSWLFDECHGRDEDLSYLESVGLISKRQIFDWEVWTNS
jgi:hypothetical protein